MAATGFETIKAHWPRSLELSGSPGTFVGPRPSFVWTLRILCSVALAITGYLAVKALRLEEVAGCGSGPYFDCSHVLHSRWSKLLGVPVSVPAFALYTVMLAALAVCRRPNFRPRLAWGVITVGSIATGIVALWFGSLQIFSVGHLCIYCLAAHSCGVALCLAILIMAPLGVRTTAQLCAVSLLGVSAFIAAQLFTTPPPTYKVEYFPTPAVKSPSTPAEKNAGQKSKNQEKPRAPEVFEAPGG
jgi:uncharacterized membrane protein